MLSHRIKISVFVKYNSNFCRLIIALKIVCFNYNLEGASVNVTKKKMESEGSAISGVTTI